MIEENKVTKDDCFLNSLEGGAKMSMESSLDELIKAGWKVLESDFNPAAFRNWQAKAFECLTEMFGPDHIYTKYFEHFAQDGRKKHVLAAGGVLIAAKQQMDRNNLDSCPNKRLSSKPSQ